MKIHTTTICLSAAAAFLAGVAIAQAHGDMAAGQNPLADNVRAANDRFKDVAAAVAEGYAPIPCASGVTGGRHGHPLRQPGLPRGRCGRRREAGGRDVRADG